MSSDSEPLSAVGQREGPARTEKGFVAGTHRTIAPEQTLERVLPMIGPMGITRLANVTGLDRLRIPVVSAFRPNARSLSVTQGKGLTLAAAKASALMEAVESYHAERIVLPLKFATFNDIRFTHRVVDIARLPRLGVSTYHDNLRTLWIEGTDLFSGTRTWVPYEMVHTDFTHPLPPGSGSFVLSSNGLASGNHLLEAIQHGIGEVVERDAITLFRQTAPEKRRFLDLSTVEDAACVSVIDRFHAADVAVAVWDATSDVGLPCFLCSIVDAQENPFRRLYANQGMGCHPSRRIALLRALTEAAQSRLTFITGARDDADRQRYEHVRSAAYVGRWRDTILNPKGPLVSFADTPTFEHEYLEQDIASALDCLAKVGIDQVIVVDLTRQEFEIPVVRVIIPGLEALDEVPGYVPGSRARAVRAE